jgi:hypothetical protein
MEVTFKKPVKFSDSSYIKKNIKIVDSSETNETSSFITLSNSLPGAPESKEVHFIPVFDEKVLLITDKKFINTQEINHNLDNELTISSNFTGTFQGTSYGNLICGNVDDINLSQTEKSMFIVNPESYESKLDNVEIGTITPRAANFSELTIKTDYNGYVYFIPYEDDGDKILQISDSPIMINNGDEEINNYISVSSNFIGTFRGTSYGNLICGNVNDINLTQNKKSMFIVNPESYDSKLDNVEIGTIKPRAANFSELTIKSDTHCNVYFIPYKDGDDKILQISDSPINDDEIHNNISVSSNFIGTFQGTSYGNLICGNVDDINLSQTEQSMFIVNPEYNESKLDNVEIGSKKARAANFSELTIKNDTQCNVYFIPYKDGDDKILQISDSPSVEGEIHNHISVSSNFIGTFRGTSYGNLICGDTSNIPYMIHNTNDPIFIVHPTDTPGHLDNVEIGSYTPTWGTFINLTVYGETAFQNLSDVKFNDGNGNRLTMHDIVQKINSIIDHIKNDDSTLTIQPISV